MKLYIWEWSMDQLKWWWNHFKKLKKDYQRTFRKCSLNFSKLTEGKEEKVHQTRKNSIIQTFDWSWSCYHPMISLILDRIINREKRFCLLKLEYFCPSHTQDIQLFHSCGWPHWEIALFSPNTDVRLLLLYWIFFQTSFGDFKALFYFIFVSKMWNLFFIFCLEVWRD